MYYDCGLSYFRCSHIVADEVSLQLPLQELYASRLNVGLVALYILGGNNSFV